MREVGLALAISVGVAGPALAQNAATSGQAAEARFAQKIEMMYFSAVWGMDESIAGLRKAAERGNAEAQRALGSMYMNGRGVARDDELAVVWLRQAAEQGTIPAQYYLGLMYANGRGIARDDAMAVMWWQKAAEKGHAEALQALRKWDLIK